MVSKCMLYYLYFKSNNNNIFRIQPNADSAADVDGLMLEILKTKCCCFLRYCCYCRLRFYCHANTK